MSAVKNKIIVILLCAAVITGQLWYNHARVSRIFYFVSMVVALGAIAMFYLSFEGRKPREREIVLVCVLCAVTAASRMIFFMLPQFKPMAAVIIICAACYGRETGFLVGSMSAFLSNFFFTQGPFTPFAMLGFGLVGYFAGVFFYGKKPPLWLLCIFGFIATYVVYGGIMNWSSVLLYTDKITLGYILTVFGLAFYFDLVHSISTVVFLILLNKGFSKRLERVKKRYGMLGG